MYKIYINETPLFLIPFDEPTPMEASFSETLTAVYRGKSKSLLNYVDMLEKTDRYDAIFLKTKDLEGLWNDFQSVFKILEAAGGVVFNAENQLLAIYRRGSWDLPKGKIDKGETPAEAAVREVMEETGLQKVELGPFLLPTYHTYQDKKGKRILKPTHWYRMYTPDQELIPQAEEDIEKAVWVPAKDFLENYRPLYKSIESLLREADL
jgi:8-oxo-dGTP pyrophosphatase MutT (NUDIX family)